MIRTLANIRIEHDSEIEGGRYSVWLGNEIVGSGEALSEAMLEAATTLTLWNFEKISVPNRPPRKPTT